MIVVDVNVLVAAAVADHPRHEVARSWLNSELARDAGGVLIPDLAWVGFVRIVTNQRIFKEPLTVLQAAVFADDVLMAPGYVPCPRSTGPSGFLALCAESSASADLVPDAYLANLALRMGCPIATFDRDFRRFDNLQVHEPAAGHS